MSFTEKIVVGQISGEVMYRLTRLQYFCLCPESAEELFFLVQFKTSHTLWPMSRIGIFGYTNPTLLIFQKQICFEEKAHSLESRFFHIVSGNVIGIANNCSTMTSRCRRSQNQASSESASASELACRWIWP